MYALSQIYTNSLTEGGCISSYLLAMKREAIPTNWNIDFSIFGPFSKYLSIKLIAKNKVSESKLNFN